jgi:FSR family fosmidomycin resistance protein-like MFS transporter
MIVPGILMTIILLLNHSMLTSPVRTAFTAVENGAKVPLSRNQKISLLVLVSVATVRSWTQLGLVSYIPFYYIDYLKGNPLYAGKLVTTFLMAGALGTVVGGPLADRWGHKNFLLATLILSFPLLLLFYHSRGLMAFILIGISGMILVSTFALTTVMAQAALPQHLGAASGLMVGFTMGAGGIGVTLLGTIADHWGVPMAMKAIFVTPLLAFGLALLIKDPPERTSP